MSEQALHQAIEQLLREIDSLDPDDESGREELLVLAEALKRRLAHGEPTVPSPDADDEPGDNAILDLVTRYESRHPQLTAVLNVIMTRLASMGI